jgi:hypothetical protein
MARDDVRRAPRTRDIDDDLTDLFNDQDATFDDLLDAMQTDDAPTEQQQSSRRDAQSSLPQEMLGIDEEVKIKKVRKPVVKLDETRQVTWKLGVSSGGHANTGLFQTHFGCRHS